MSETWDVASDVCYLASWNFLSLLGRPWFLRCLNHLWTCLTEQPVFLLKLSMEVWGQEQDKEPFRDVHVVFLHIHGSVCLQLYLCGMLRCAAEIGLQDRIRRGANPFFVMHAQQGGQRTRYFPERTNRYLSDRMMHRSTRLQLHQAHLSNICLTNRKQIVMGMETHRSGSLG